MFLKNGLSSITYSACILFIQSNILVIQSNSSLTVTSLFWIFQFPSFWCVDFILVGVLSELHLVSWPHSLWSVVSIYLVSWPHSLWSVVSIYLCQLTSFTVVCCLHLFSQLTSFTVVCCLHFVSWPHSLWSVVSIYLVSWPHSLWSVVSIYLCRLISFTLVCCHHSFQLTLVCCHAFWPIDLVHFGLLSTFISVSWHHSLWPHFGLHSLWSVLLIYSGLLTFSLVCSLHFGLDFIRCGSVIALDIFQAIVTSIRWWKWFMESGQSL